MFFRLENDFPCDWIRYGTGCYCLLGVVDVCWGIKHKKIVSFSFERSDTLVFQISNSPIISNNISDDGTPLISPSPGTGSIKTSSKGTEPGEPRVKDGIQLDALIHPHSY